ncbi:hypothetical protein ABZ914_03235 [Spirillospora sp. NPDC046719]
MGCGPVGRHRAGRGVGGSLLGARAAIKGARYAAALTADAARQQVTAQAEIEHRHWVRQERQKAYREVLDAYAELSPVIWKFHESLIGGWAPTSDDLLDLDAEFGALYGACTRLALLGPQEATAAGEVLRRALQDVEAAFQRFEEPGPAGEDRDRLLTVMRASVVTLRTRYLEFMKESQRILLSGAD